MQKSCEGSKKLLVKYRREITTDHNNSDKQFCLSRTYVNPKNILRLVPDSQAKKKPWIK